MINLLNLTDAEDIYSLMAGLAEDAHGGSADQCAQRQLDAMEPFRAEICAWARGNGDPDAKQAALSYLLEMADLSAHLGDGEREGRLYAAAKQFARDILVETDSLEDFQQLCRVTYRQLAIYWDEQQEMPGKTTCNYLLQLARTMYRMHPEWDRQECLEELAKIYGINAKWYGTYDRNSAWHTLCVVRAKKIRLYLDHLHCRKDLEDLRDSLFDAAERFMDEYWDWDPKQARQCFIQALNLMKRNPWLSVNGYLTASAYDRIAQTYESEEEYARINELEYSSGKRISSRCKAKDYRLKSLNLWLNFLRHRERQKLDTGVARMCLRDCYEALAEDFGCLPGEKNAAKAKKYRQKAEEIIL